MTNALASDLARALDPVTLARRVELDPDPWQERVLRSTADRILLNIHRQGGKSITAALLAVWTALYISKALILLLSPAQRQSQELFRHCLAFYRAIGRPVPSEAENRLTLELENGSRIVSLPGQEATIRSYSGVTLLVVDEAARVPDETYFAVTPMLATSGGRIIGMSTPAGKRGWWHQAWIDESQQWEGYEVPATECRRITPEFLERERAAMGEWWFRQEYLCEFVDAQEQLFATDDIEAMFTDNSVKALFPVGPSG